MKQAPTDKQALIDKLVAAVLYEGYLLYPYRPSVKNTQRWTFGGLFPQSYCESRRSSEAWYMQCQCLLIGDVDSRLDAVAEFLQLVDRRLDEGSASASLSSDPAALLEKCCGPAAPDVQRGHAWQEAEERKAALESVPLGDLLAAPQCVTFHFPEQVARSPASSADADRTVLREQRALACRVELNAERLAAPAAKTSRSEQAFKLTARVANVTPLAEPAHRNSAEAQLYSLASTHIVLSAVQGEFASLVDPPERWREAAAGCRNERCWPVLVGEPPQRNTMLAAPIILYDYPQIAAESPGELFDSTEIDEILTLRIMTLTESEKAEMAAADPRGRALLQRVNSLGPDQLLALHGMARNP